MYPSAFTMTPEPRLFSRSSDGGVLKSRGLSPKNRWKNGSVNGDGISRPGVRMTLEDDTLTTAVTAFLTIGAKPSWKETIAPPPGSPAAVRIGISLPVFAFANEPAIVPTARATINPTATADPLIW